MRRGLTFIACVSAFIFMLVQLGVRYTSTSSIPNGLYVYFPGVVSRGDFVQACLPTDLATFGLDLGIMHVGSCSDGIAPVVKVLAAVYPDVVEVRNDAIFINGKAWPMSASRSVDAEGRLITFRMKPGIYHVGLFQVLLLGLHPRSWDGRVWGLLPRSIVSGRWVPIPLLTYSGKETP